MIHARCPRRGRGWGGLLAVAHVVGRQRRLCVRAVAMGRRRGRHPAVLVNAEVVAAHVVHVVHTARIGIVGRNVPAEGNLRHAGVEAQVLRRVVGHAVCAEQPDALQVERHVHLVARVGVEAVEPYLVVGRVDALHPHLVHQHIGLHLVVVAAVYHQLVLLVKVLHSAQRLLVGEIVYRPGSRRQRGSQHNHNDCNTFHSNWC